MHKKPLVVVTGASAGIGAAVARRFAKGGYRLALLARRLDRLKTFQQELGDETSVYEVDVSDSQAVDAAFSVIEQKVGPIDILVNNAGGVVGLDPAYKANLQEWEQMVDVNIKGLLYCTHAALPRMVERNHGHIINLGSIAGTYPYPGGNVYGATKAFVHQFSLNLRADLLGKNVRVSCIEPGLVGGTEFSVVRFRGDAQKAAGIYENTQPLLAEDVAEIIYFCAALPPHVNINTVEFMPTCQASAPLSIHKK